MALPKAADVKRYTFPAYLKASNYRGETPMDWYSPWTASRDCIDVYFPQIPYRLSSSEALEYVRQPEVSNICPHKIIIEMCFVINRKCVDGDSIGIDPGTEEMPSKETGKGYSGPGDLEWASCMALEEDFEIGDFMGAVTDDDKHKIWNGEQFWACHYVMKAKYAYPR
ncbi:hypothetical protein GCM10008956_29890 [Deinococcus arenae]|uniref:Uncharacterized protein n=2 Tax=Deinococcus arenae TaxID=1452751 RepID=A0A8H9GRF9_9DEIO|nr:hypothetical protein GCM10008956_29890 [Deinococcus arenae]